MIAPTQNGYTYFPGCSLTATNRPYDISTRSVAAKLGLDFQELDDWNCCGATAYMAISEKRSFVLSGRNLALAEKEGKDLVTVCNACYLVLRKCNKCLAEDPKLNADIQKALAEGGMTYNGKVKVRHFLDVIVSDFGEREIRAKVTKPLKGLQVAPYYGCQIGRPYGEIDDEENPQMLDRLIGWIGADAVDYPLKAKCCGGMLMTTQPEIGKELSGRLLKLAKNRGADCIVTACPLCQMNLEAYQSAISNVMGTDCSIPILYFTQLLGSALGMRDEELAIEGSMTPVGSMLSKVGSVS